MDEFEVLDVFTPVVLEFVVLLLVFVVFTAVEVLVVLAALLPLVYWRY